MDVGAWLRNLGLGQYEAAFRENEIDVEVLPDLTDADLEKLGVPMGHRKRLLKAVAGLSGADWERAPGQPVAKIEPNPHDAAERRQLTVMFCDLVGSTALAARLDPEDMRGIIAAYHKCCATLISGNGGFVAKYMGDGVLAYFGYPHAHEHDPERAVRAGLAIVEAAPKLVTAVGAPLHVRVGIATGIVVVGDLLGSGESQERGVVGDTPNLAARLQAIAEPGAVVIAESTRALLGDLFEFRDLGAQELKGVTGPTRAYGALRESSQESRFEALHAAGLTALVGREEESELLLRRWAKAKAGEGQVVLLSGEAGIGKSRLTAAMLERLIGEPHVRMRYFCSPQHTDSALYPIIGHMARAAGLARDDDAKMRLDKLDALLTRSATSREDSALLAEMLSLSNDGRYPAPELSPQQRRQKTLQALIGQIEAISGQTPVLMIFEDAHWADPSSLEVFGRLVERIAGLGVLLLVTFRPEFAAPWIGRPHVAALTINRLTPREVMALIDRVAGDKPLATNIRQNIVERADGVPLFVEEMTKAVLEAAGEGAVVRAVASVPSSTRAVPASLHASLTARLDRLGDAREAAQIAAVIGRQFAFSLLAAITAKSDLEIEAALEKLVNAGIVFPEQGGLERDFSFKHALVREAAYHSLLLSRRREWHERCARALEERFAELAANEPELLAHHFGEAGLAGPACDYRMRGGERAISRAAYTEAVAHFSIGLRETEKLPEAAERMRRQLAFLLKLGPALMVTRGLGSVEAENAFRKAAEMSAAAGNDPTTFQAKWGLWLIANVGLKSAAQQRAHELVALAHRSGDGDLLLEAYHCRWSTAFLRGDITETIENSLIGVETYDFSRHRHLGHAFAGHDPGVCAHSMCGLAYQANGEPKVAEEYMARALELGEALDQPNNQAFALYGSGMSRQLVGDRDATLAFARRSVTISEKFGLAPWRVGSLVLVAWATAMGGAAADAGRLIDAEMEQMTSASAAVIYNLALAAEVLLAANRPSDGIALLDRVLTAAEEPGVGFYLSEIYRVRGECLLAIDRKNKEEARQAFALARDIANRQGALILARRAEASLLQLT